MPNPRSNPGFYLRELNIEPSRRDPAPWRGAGMRMSKGSAPGYRRATGWANEPRPIAPYDLTQLRYVV